MPSLIEAVYVQQMALVKQAAIECVHMLFVDQQKLFAIEI